MIHLSFADKRAEEAVAVPHQSFNQVRDEASGGAWPRLGEIITSGENIEIRFLFTLMKCYFQGGPPDEHHFLLNVPKVTVSIFISSSPGTSRAGGTPTPSQLIYFMPYYSPISWYPIPSLLMNILLHGLEMSTALSRSHRQECPRGPGGTGVQPDERGEPENS